MKVPHKAIKICRNFILRSGTVAGFMYYFQQAGVWGTPMESGQLYENFKNKLTPHTTELMNRFPNETAMISRLGDIGTDLLEYYNVGVKETFSFMKNLPENTQELAKQAAEICREKREQFIEISKSKLKLRATAPTVETNEIPKAKILKSDEDQTNNQDNTNVSLESHTSDTDPESMENKQQLLLLSSCL